ncbi:hypothetical protein L1887_53975 [Cichorium endivia]|nr:hypothetical protein L1887_53975 [Cichorium endivia]
MEIEAQTLEYELLKGEQALPLAFEHVGIDVRLGHAADRHSQRSGSRSVTGSGNSMLAFLASEGGEGELVGVERILGGRRQGHVGGTASDVLRVSKRIAGEQDVARLLVRVVELCSDKERGDGGLVQHEIRGRIEEVESLVDLLRRRRGSLWKAETRCDGLDEAGGDVAVRLPRRRGHALSTLPRVQRLELDRGEVGEVREGVCCDPKLGTGLGGLAQPPLRSAARVRPCDWAGMVTTVERLAGLRHVLCSTLWPSRRRAFGLQIGCDGWWKAQKILVCRSAVRWCWSRSAQLRLSEVRF